MSASSKAKGKARQMDETQPSSSALDSSNLEALLVQCKTTLAAKFPSSAPSLDRFSSDPSTRRSTRRSLKARLRALKSRKPLKAFQTVFAPSNTIQPLSLVPLLQRTLDHKPPISAEEFLKIVDSVRLAIVHPSKPLLPKLNLSGSSGSYFCKALVDGNPEVVGIFKPKDEEPYGAMNPKWTKWFHRVLLAPLIGGFGRSCLIPNLSYLSEAAASLLDRRLEAYIVPHTQVVNISSPTFFYSWLDRQAAARKSKPRPLPPKPGSFQVFCTGFENASTVLRTHPWPGRPLNDTFDPHQRRRPRKTCSLYRLLCGQRSDVVDSESETEASDEEQEEDKLSGPLQHPIEWYWTQELMDDFRHEMEKLVILDYLMRNTDRGLDNFMIKVCNANCHNSRSRKVSNVTVRSTSSSQANGGSAALDGPDDHYRRPHCHVAAIDNSLAFPHHHPNGWRDYSYGWLFLPVSLIGQPFSAPTRAHYLRLLTDPKWWAETVFELQRLFSTDPDFNVKMFERQMALLKGQGWNIVESLRHSDEGPLELCRRKKVLVWDEPIEIPTKASIPIPVPFGSHSEQHHTRTSTAPTDSIHKLKPPITRSWSAQTSESGLLHRPPRPTSLATRLTTGKEDIKGARGVDVMKQMDAMQAWEDDEDDDQKEMSSPGETVTSYGTFHQPMMEQEENQDDEVDDDDDDDDDRNLLISKSLIENVNVGFEERLQFVKAQPVFKNC